MQVPSGSRGNRASSTRASPQTVWTSQRWPRTSLRTGFLWSRFIKRFKASNHWVSWSELYDCMMSNGSSTCDTPSDSEYFRALARRWSGVQMSRSFWTSKTWSDNSRSHEEMLPDTHTDDYVVTWSSNTIQNIVESNSQDIPPRFLM